LRFPFEGRKDISLVLAQDAVSVCLQCVQTILFGTHRRAN